MSTQTIHEENMQEIFRLSNAVADGIHKNIHKVLVGQDINFTGGLDKSFFKTQQDDFVIIASNSPYAIPVDRGMPPGTIVNFDSLLIWVKGKLGISDDAEAKEVTFKIRNKIITTGIKPTRFIKKAINMFIMKHGVVSARSGRATSRTRNKGILKYIKRAVKIIKKMNRALSKTSKFLNKLKSVSK